MPSDLIRVLSRDEIAQRIKALANRISKDYAGKEICAIGVLKGAFIFLSDLVRQLTIPVQIDFVRLASYGDSAESSENVRITKGIELDIRDRHVLVVEDIVDCGRTMAFLLEYLKGFHPKSVKVCALITKTERREMDVPIDYVGYGVEHGFLVGYGLDFAEKYRNLPEIYRIKV
ncbi:MAG: hypoxanthine phosphoribosyltransferase [Deltaproteobacteria bacterium]|nr:hypoxanthine phosphoribosyltransferase [Deltaproteobacteria bacterium]